MTSFFRALKPSSATSERETRKTVIPPLLKAEAYIKPGNDEKAVELSQKAYDLPLKMNIQFPLYFLQRLRKNNIQMVTGICSEDGFLADMEIPH
jgi:hypothetical protein